ncbi:hypothetical protein [Stenotrophomonas sp. YIM B06876]|uniref:hypothetical protein n=1 Tax=Stenotrophomonas sp. YIM B06876 TaxID=3060211 RepID=UPI0027393BAE|nr:hypothetical protein [Stenotrophomonas sp. YIM B06876]
MSRRLLFPLLLLCAGLLPAASAAAGRAIWTWEAESYAMLDDPAVATEAIAYLKAQHIDSVYLYADGYRGRNLIVEQPQRYRTLIERLHRNGMQAYALLGSAYLNTETYILPEHRADAEAMFRRVLDYNAAAPRAARFDGVNLDIEPHILDEWDDHTRERLLGDFLDMSAALMRIKRDYRATLAVGPAIPFWLDGITLEWQGRSRPVSEHVIDLYDYVALMDYRDKAEGADSILSHAASEIAYANRARKKVVIGVEVSPNEIDKVTFDEEGPVVFERELAKVQKALQREPAFAGFAIHHYRAYRRWKGRAWE